MTIQKTLEMILKRLDAIEATQSDVEDTVDDIKTMVTTIEHAVDNLDGDLSGDDIRYSLETLAEAERRRERLEWLQGARAAMERAS